jgi:hypothetical protein
MQQGDEVAIVTGASKGIGRLRQRRCIRPDSACSAPPGGPPASLRKRFKPIGKVAPTEAGADYPRIVRLSVRLNSFLDFLVGDFAAQLMEPDSCP